MTALWVARKNDRHDEPPTSASSVVQLIKIRKPMNTRI